MHRIPMPSPRGTNFAGRFLPASFPFTNEPTMAMDAAMRPEPKYMFRTREEAAAYGRAYARRLLTKDYGMAFDGPISPPQSSGC
jgi:hypothetical protein